jgi:Family of unknown function (DUF6298)
MACRRFLLLIVLLAAVAPSAANAQEAINVDPANPKYLLFRGKPLVLVSASEHYGSVINRSFDYEKYLADAAEHKMTMTRTFLLYRELQSARNPSSPCKPESPDYISPFLRTGPGKAMDGEPVYDLDQWNPEYFERLHHFLDAASKRGIVVELTVFSNSYSPDTWALNPLRAENNLQHVGAVAWQEYITLKDKELVRRQIEYARKIIRETSEYDNVYYEICNEPGGGIPGHATPADVDAWQDEMARVMCEEMQRLNRPHLLSGQQAFTYGAKNAFPMDATFSGKTFDIVNDHPLPNTLFNERVFEMGNFMSKELMLDGVGSFCRAAYSRSKPTVLDEDNTASLYRDTTGWTIHRKRAWTALLNGCQYDYIDFSITVGSESETIASRAEIRTWMQHLSEFMTSFDFVDSKPDTSWIAEYPEHVLASGLSAGEHDYIAYIADLRELSDPHAGEPIGGSISLALPPGNYNVSLYSPIGGEYSPAIQVKGGTKNVVVLPEFKQYLVIRATLMR